MMPASNILCERLPPRFRDHPRDLDLRDPAPTRSAVVVARAGRRRWTIWGMGKRCARMIGSVQPSEDAASNSSARTRLGVLRNLRDVAKDVAIAALRIPTSARTSAQN